MNKLYEEASIKDIANAIREKNKGTDSYKVSQMGDAIREIRGCELEDKNVTVNKDYKPSQGYDGFGNVSVRVGRRPFRSAYVDDEGKFVRPVEWDDIESQPLDGTTSELWLLYDNTIPESWVAFTGTCNTGTYTVDIGRIINGVFNILNTYTIATKAMFSVDLTTTFPDQDYLVVHTYPSNATAYFSAFAPSNWTYNGSSHGSGNQSLLMRYGCLPKITSLALWGNQYIISDNIINMKSLTSLSSFLSGANALVRHRHTGWNTTNVTNASSMFSNCYSLSDMDTDFSGWFGGGKLTNISTFFGGCYSIVGDVNVTGWNTEKVTTVASMFNNAYNITRIVGIEGWYLPLCNNSTNSTFNNCYSLHQNDDGVLDLSGWRLAESVTNTTVNTLASTFYYCMDLKKIDISTWNLERCSSLASTFGWCLRLEEVNLPESIGLLSKPTTMTSMFTYCIKLKKLKFPKIDISNVTTVSSLFASCYGLEEVDFSNLIGVPAGGSSSNTMTSVFNSCYMIREVDLSWIDCTKFTYATSQLGNPIQYDVQLVELYPQQNINKNYTCNSSVHLSHDSIMRIINNLVNVTTATTLTVGVNNLAKLTDEEKAIATGKGWTLA